ncbi:MAG: AzlC family ABC transporter permease [Clostridia bacterium]|nr:AzlC family ABC transporter permease [Clostridia bacterium]
MLRMLRKSFARTLPVLAGYIFLGIAYGVALKEKGFGVEWAFLISVCVYAGSMQFAMLGALTQPFAPITMALMTLLVNARHIFYGLSMLDKYAGTGKYKPYLIFSLTDETYSLVCNEAPSDEQDRGRWYTSIALMDQCYWVTGSVLGSLLGQVIPFDLTGIDFAMTALFAVIVTEQSTDAYKGWRQGRLSGTDMLFPSLLGLLATLGSLLIIGKESFLLVSMALMLGCFFVRYQTRKGGAGE